MNATIDLNLLPFCDPESTRYSLGEPFVSRGHLVATDGMKLVCVPTSDPETVDRKLPNVWEIIKKRASGELVAWPEALYSDKVQTCRRCKGNGGAHNRECEHCDGEGTIECCECGSEVDCDECDGNGAVICGKCPDCKGAKECAQPYSIEVGGRLIAWANDQAIRTLPNVKFLPMESATSCCGLSSTADSAASHLWREVNHAPLSQTSPRPSVHARRRQSAQRPADGRRELARHGDRANEARDCPAATARRSTCAASSHPAAGCICCWCEKPLELSADCYDHCNHCKGSFSFRKPITAAERPTLLDAKGSLNGKESVAAIRELRDEWEG